VVQVLLRLSVPARSASQTVKALAHIAHGIRREDASATVHVATDAEDDGVFWLSEEWPSVEQCERHLRSQQFARLLALIETSEAPPLLQCRLIAESRGVDYFAAVRAAEEPPTPPHLEGPSKS
jgi:quinol monooxygenase YgiN